MATLENQTIASTYTMLLKMADTGIDATLNKIESGDADDGALALSTTAIGIDATDTMHFDGIDGAFGASNTYIHEAAADRLDFVVGGDMNGFVLLEGSGVTKVGIGTAAPAAALQVEVDSDDVDVFTGGSLTAPTLLLTNKVAAEAGQSTSLGFNTGAGDMSAAIVAECVATTGSGIARLNFHVNNNNGWTDATAGDGGAVMTLYQGKVGIGTLSPDTALTVVDDTLSSGDTSTIKVSGTGNSVEANAELSIYYHSSQFGTAAPVSYLRHEASDGTAAFFWMSDVDSYMGSTASANIGTQTGVVVGASLASDERLKDISGDSFPYGLSDINKITPIKYKRKKGDNRDRLGFGAQTIQSIIPESVQDTKECIHGYTYEKQEGKKMDKCIPKGDTSETKLVMEYHQIIPVLVKAVQELSAKVTALENA